MSSVPDEMAALQEENEILRGQVADLRERLRRAEERLQWFEALLDWSRRLFAVDNHILSAAQKVVMWVTWCYIFSLWDVSNVEGQWVELPVGGVLSPKTGLSSDTCGKAVKALHGVGLLEREERTPPVGEREDGIVRTHIFVRLGLLSWTPEALRLQPGEKGRGHGGDREPRQHCVDCGSDRLLRETRIVCGACGRQQGEVIVEPVNDLDEEDGGRASVGDMPDEHEVLEHSDVQESGCYDAETFERLDTGAQDAAWRVVSPAGGQVQPVVVPKARARPPRPEVECKFCHVRAWIWYEGEQQYVCLHCYSPAPGQSAGGGQEQEGGR
jgi:hypothetical protein